MSLSPTVLITGASGLFGGALIKGFLSDGYKVIGLTSSEGSKITLQDQNFEAVQNGQFNCFACDFLRGDAIAVLISSLISAGIYPEFVVHGARSTKFLKIEENGTVNNQNFTGEFQLGVLAPYELSTKLVKMENSQLKSIVFIASMYGVVPPNPSLYINFEKESAISYGVVKAAQIHLTKELAVRFAPFKVRVNSVSFGGVEGRVSEEFKLKYAKLNPLGRMLRVDEIYSPVEFLVSEKSSAITGHNLQPDGGWTVW